MAARADFDLHLLEAEDALLPRRPCFFAVRSGGNGTTVSAAIFHRRDRFGAGQQGDQIAKRNLKVFAERIKEREFDRTASRVPKTLPGISIGTRQLDRFDHVNHVGK